MTILLKLCTLCKQDLPVDRFIPRADRPGTFHAWCKECRNGKYKGLYRSDPAFRAARIAEASERKKTQRLRPEVRERERVASRERKRIQLADPVEYEKHLARNRAWVAANKEREQQYESRQPAAKAARAKRRYERMKATPEGRAKLKEDHAKYSPVALRNRRARKLKAPGKHTRADVLRQIEKQSGHCFWCSEAIPSGKHTVDHYVPLTKGGSNNPDNLVIACRSCNSRKWALDPEEFARRRKK